MDPIQPVTGLIDRTEALLGHSPHPAVVAVPIGAWTVSNICDGLALAGGGDRYDDVARVSMGVGLAGAAVSIVTGLRDYAFIPKERPGHDIATTHALGNALVASLFTASYVLRERDAQAGRPTGLLARVLGLAGGGLSVYTAWLGGVLVQEHGEAVKPVMERMSHEEPTDHGHAQGRERLSAGSPLGARG